MVDLCRHCHCIVELRVVIVLHSRRPRAGYVLIGVRVYYCAAGITRWATGATAMKRMQNNRRDICCAAEAALKPTSQSSAFAGERGMVGGGN